MSASDLCRKPGVSDAMFYIWRKKYGGLKVSGCQATEVSGEREYQADEASGGADDGCIDAPIYVGKNFWRLVQ